MHHPATSATAAVHASAPRPVLAPPGAGLPRPELLVARALFALRRARGGRQAHVRVFREERARIAALVAGCPAGRATERVLIARIPGLEDSSRWWSVCMTLDHLRIVHGAMAEVVDALARDVVPPGMASTAAVKPAEDAAWSVVAEYERSCDHLLATVERLTDGQLRSRARYAHPWFGPLDAMGWVALAGMHMGIHRRQIERILQGLEPPAPRQG
jgi:hypothetical protein